jgi:hypothetical protein
MEKRKLSYLDSSVWVGVAVRISAGTQNVLAEEFRDFVSPSKKISG